MRAEIYICDYHLRPFLANRVKILIVDDERDILDSLKHGLELKGFEVDAYGDPLEALAHFRKQVYEMALLDVRMPRMNGFQLYREMLKMDGRVKVRFLTAFEEYRDEFKRAFPELDERRFIRKPMTMGRLADIINGDLKITG